MNWFRKSGWLALSVAFFLLFGCAAPTPAASVSSGSQNPPDSVAAQGKDVQTQPSGGMLRVHYLDVGQADCTYLELPDGKTMLIDAGDLGGGPAILDYLAQQNCEKLDYVIATHPHSDHIGGMADIISGIEVGAFYMPKVTHTSKTFEAMVGAVAAKGLKINVAKAGKMIPAEGYTLEFAAPVQESYDNLNNYSAVLKVTYGDTSFLFTGDAETLSEEQITTDVKSDVLKVGHHGSDTSTSAGFLKRVSPKYAVISVGEGNSYGHPAGSTLRALSEAGAAVYRTDRDGTVVLSSDGKTIVPGTAPVSESVPSTEASPAQAAADPASETVWITASGRKYHADPGCSNIKNASEIPLSQALERGLAPCKKCFP